MELYGRHPIETEHPETQESVGVRFPPEQKEGRYQDESLFSKEQVEILRKENNFKCVACRFLEDSSKEGASSDLAVHVVVPMSKGGKIEVENGTVLCNDCHTTVHEVAFVPPKEKPQLTKAAKRRVWEMKGKTCEDCAMQFDTGGSHQAIHPFRPANWDGALENLKVLCTSCVGVEASKRDKILQLADKLR